MIFSTHDLHPEVTARLQAAGDYRVASSPSAEAILAEGQGAEVLIVRAPIPAAYLAAAPGLRALVRHGAGLDMIPMAEATASGVLVANVPGVNAATVAEHVLFSAIALRRGARRCDTTLRGTGWGAARALADTSRDLGGAVVGIVGMGNIGTKVAALATAFGCTVQATTRRPATLPASVASLPLDALIASSDLLVLCCPLTPETTGLLSAARLARMPAGAVVINVSRGAVIDEAALITALQSGHLGGAALDVFTQQPLPKTSPLWAMDNVLLTPHIAGITQDSMYRMGSGALAEVLRILANKLPENFCNPAVEPAYRTRFPA